MGKDFGKGDRRRRAAWLAYLVYRQNERAQAQAARFSGNPAIRFKYTVISNIYSRGLPPVEAGVVILEKAFQVLSCQAAGNRLASLEFPERDRALDGVGAQDHVARSRI
jgi:ethanolamine ammonia-lyase large subunit